MKKVFYTALIPVILAGVLFTCSQQKEETETTAVVDESAIAVTLTAVKAGDFTRPIVSSGLITTGTESRLSFKTGGIVTSILVDEGDDVRKGQLLATLDLTEIDAQVGQSKNNVEKTERDLARVEKLYRDSAATLEQFQNARTAFEVAKQSYSIASFNKQYSTIHATVSGKVIRKFVNEGELVGGGSPVLTINSATENDWVVRIGLPDVDWVRVKKGDAAVIKTDAYPGQLFNATVSLINEAADPVSGLYAAEVKVSPAGRKLAAGLVAAVEIIPSVKNKLKSIPIEALVEGSGSDAFVFVADEDGKSVKKLSVRVAYITASDAIIASGLDSVAEVITAGSAFLTEYSSIKVIENPTAKK